MSDGFHNPYNFVAPLPRAQATNTPLGDAVPVAHGRYHADLWTGRLEIAMTTITPLLLLDQARRRGGDSEHRTYPVRTLADGTPYIAPTAVKGMLRAAYETVTNSRFGVLGEWNKRLGYRRETQTALKLQAVRIDGGRIQFLKHARLGRYGDREKRYLDTGQFPKHGDEAWAIVQRGTVTAIVRDKAHLRGNPVRGWVHVTGRNIEGKRYERFFYRPGRVVNLADHPHLAVDWRALMRDAMEANGSATGGADTDRPERSLHLRSDGEDVREFREPLLAYAECDGDRIVALYPVLVSRALHERPPIDFLDETMRPATSLAELSPADRVFGWVANGKGGAHRGQLRISQVQPGPDSRAVTIDGGLPLAILSGPKPHQARFYLGQRDARAGSIAQPAGRSKVDAGYGGDLHAKTLRGRKVYPHQRSMEPLDWSNPREPGREYNRDEESSQNATVEGWVSVGARFAFTVEVTNLGDVELGALLWLLTRNDVCFKLGAGRPLGFGSVRLELVGTDLGRGRDLAERYRSFGTGPPPLAPDPAVLAARFEGALQAVYGRPAAELPFVSGFLAAGRGVEGPVHYPRLTPEQDPSGESFRWFTRNEGGRRVSLPSLTDGRRLPYAPR